MSRAGQCAMVVLLDGRASDTDAANIRGGLRAMRGVVRVVPVEGMPSDHDAVEAIRRDVMGEGYAELELVRQQRDELASRLSSAKDALSGPIPLPRWEQRTAWEQATGAFDPAFEGYDAKGRGPEYRRGFADGGLRRRAEEDET